MPTKLDTGQGLGERDEVGAAGAAQLENAASIRPRGTHAEECRDDREEIGMRRRVDPVGVRDFVITGRGRDCHEVLGLGTIGSGPDSGRGPATPVAPECPGIVGRPADRGTGTPDMREDQTFWDLIIWAFSAPGHDVV
jgi:hypothetical protein